MRAVPLPAKRPHGENSPEESLICTSPRGRVVADFPSALKFSEPVFLRVPQRRPSSSAQAAVSIATFSVSRIIRVPKATIACLRPVPFVPQIKLVST